MCLHHIHTQLSSPCFHQTHNPTYLPPTFVSSYPVCDARSPISAVCWMLTHLVGMILYSNHSRESMSVTTLNSTLPPPPHLPALPFFIAPLPWRCSLSLVRRFSIDIPFRVEPSEVTYSHHFDQLTADHWRNKFPRPVESSVNTWVRWFKWEMSPQAPVLEHLSWVGGITGSGLWDSLPHLELVLCFLFAAEEVFSFLLATRYHVSPTIVDSPSGTVSQTPSLSCLCLWSFITLATEKYKHYHLEGSFTTCSFSKTTRVHLPLGPMASPGWAFHRVYSTRHELPPIEQASNPTRSWLDVPVNFTGTSFQENWCCSIRGSLLGDTVDDFSTLAACIEPFES